LVVETQPEVGFFEVHAENYMGPADRRIAICRRCDKHYPLSLHGVGLSIGANRPLDRDHLRRLKDLIERYEPALLSEHLAWSTHDAGFLNDLLPVPYTSEALRRVEDHINEIQEALGRQMLLENPSTYLAFNESAYSETDFIAEVVKRTGCGLLLDVNSRLGSLVAPRVVRIALALPFLRSGFTRWDGFLSISPGTDYLFEEQFKLHIFGGLYGFHFMGPSP
jgi:uncharacterized protein